MSTLRLRHDALVEFQVIPRMFFLMEVDNGEETEKSIEA